MRSAISVVGGVERRVGVRRGAGSGTDQCRRRWPAGSSSSWALSQTATTRSPSLSDVADVRRVWRVEAQAVAAADADRARVHPVARVGAGRGRRDGAGLLHSAAASWERAELAVQTNTTRAGAWHAEGMSPLIAASRVVADQPQVAAPPVALRTDPPDQAGLSAP